jgi:hypothetical protein
MWSFISQSELATAVLDFTNDLAPLLVGLLGVVWLSSGMIVWAAIHHYLSRTPETGVQPTSPAGDLRDAA